MTDETYDSEVAKNTFLGYLMIGLHGSVPNCEMAMIIPPDTMDDSYYIAFCNHLREPICCIELRFGSQEYPLEVLIEQDEELPFQIPNFSMAIDAVLKKYDIDRSEVMIRYAVPLEELPV